MNKIYYYYYYNYFIKSSQVKSKDFIWHKQTCSSP